MNANVFNNRLSPVFGDNGRIADTVINPLAAHGAEMVSVAPGDSDIVGSKLGPRLVFT